MGGLLEQSVAPRTHNAIPLESDFGLTHHASSPAEFSYFWEHWLRLRDRSHHELEEADWQACDLDGLRREFRLLGSLHAGPLMFKKEWLGMNAGHLLETFPSARVLHITRRPIDVARSILKARRAVFGHRNSWWGAQPHNHQRLRSLPWADQIAGQIAAIERATLRAADTYPDRFLTIAYESLVKQTQTTVQQIHDWVGLATPFGIRDACCHLPQQTFQACPDERTDTSIDGDISELVEALARWLPSLERSKP